MSKRIVYECESCGTTHSTVMMKGPDDKKPRLHVLDCSVRRAPEPSRFKEEDSGIPHIPSRINQPVEWSKNK